MTTTKTSPSKAIKLSDIKHWDMETDVAIIGFGGAGSCAAIEASDAGAKVDIFEASSAPGGSTALSGGEVYLGGSGGTVLQKKYGFEDSFENMFNYLMLQNGPQADTKKISAYVEGAASHFDWLVDKGVPFKDSYYEERVIEPMTDDCLFWSGNEKVWPELEQCTPVPRAHVVQMEGAGAGALLMERLQKSVADRGINIHCEARALCLVIDEEDTVVGLVVRIDGKEVTCKACAGVILCAGGFIMNEAMVEKNAPKLTRCNIPIGNPGDTGSGIQMGVSVGANTINMHEGFITLPFYPPSSMTYAIIVTDKGQRFINEDAYHGRVGTHLMAQNAERIFIIADVDAYGEYEQFNLLGADVVGTGETAEELEKELGMATGALARTLDIYNQHAADGSDPMYHKQAPWLRPLEPPYVALDVTPGRGCFFPGFTLGGLETLPGGEVVRPDGSTIKGLYAAGRTTAGVPRTGSGYNSGISIGDATFFGRQAGISAAKQKDPHPPA